jgi:hypothetical protein
MSVARALVRLLGWLLTPLVALAASFAGAWLGASLAGSLKSSSTGAWVVIGFGAGFGLVAAWAWLHYLRRSPRLQQSLAVAPDGTPLAATSEKTPQDSQ